MFYNTQTLYLISFIRNVKDRGERNKNVRCSLRGGNRWELNLIHIKRVLEKPLFQIFLDFMILQL